jgi:hypothetical protein
MMSVLVACYKVNGHRLGGRGSIRLRYVMFVVTLLRAGPVHRVPVCTSELQGNVRAHTHTWRYTWTVRAHYKEFGNDVRIEHVARTVTVTAGPHYARAATARYPHAHLYTVMCFSA